MLVVLNVFTFHKQSLNGVYVLVPILLTFLSVYRYRDMYTHPCVVECFQDNCSCIVFPGRLVISGLVCSGVRGVVVGGDKCKAAQNPIEGRMTATIIQ